MGIQDREWYQEELRKKLANKDSRYFPKQLRGKPRVYIPRYKNEPQPQAKKVHWTIVLMTCLAALLIVTALMRYLYR